jgi:hypothetical protein
VIFAEKDAMDDFLGNYGFFILIALLMVICHLGHGSHGGHRRRNEERDGASSPGDRHQH